MASVEMDKFSSSVYVSSENRFSLILGLCG
jgi:hypothetical protein